MLVVPTSQIVYHHCEDAGLNKETVLLVARVKLSLFPTYTSADSISDFPIRAVPIFFIHTVTFTPAGEGGDDRYFAYVVTILKSVRMLLSVAADADENVPTMFQIMGRTATIRMEAATTPVISIIAETKVSEATVSYPVREVHPVFFHLLVLGWFLLFCRYGRELDLHYRRWCHGRYLL